MFDDIDVADLLMFIVCSHPNQRPPVIFSSADKRPFNGTKNFSCQTNLNIGEIGWEAACLFVKQTLFVC